MSWLRAASCHLPTDIHFGPALPLPSLAMPSPPRMLAAKGKTLSLSAWARESGIPAATIRARLDLFGWPVERAVTAPVNRKLSSARAGRPAPHAPRSCPPMRKSTRGQAFARWTDRGRRFQRWFGAWGTAEAAEVYRRFQLEWAQGLAVAKSLPGGLLVVELVEAYVAFAEGYYLKHGRRTSEQHAIKAATAALVRVAGSKLVGEVKPDDLRACQAELVAKGNARKTVNAYVNRIRRCFDWGAAHTGADGRPLVPAELVLALQKVRGLVRGRTPAPDHARVTAVAWADVAATFEHLNPDEVRRAVLEALIRTQWLTGIRSTELLRMRPVDLDRSKPEWRYRVPPELNKVEHMERETDYWIGPKAQAVIAPFVAGCPDDRPVFALPRLRGEGFRVLAKDDYRRLVAAACKAAGVPAWTPHQLRHARATEVERIYEDSGAAAAAIGDTPEVVRRVYLDPNEAYRRRIARETG